MTGLDDRHHPEHAIDITGIRSVTAFEVQALGDINGLVKTGAQYNPFTVASHFDGAAVRCCINGALNSAGIRRHENEITVIMSG